MGRFICDKIDYGSKIIYYAVDDKGVNYEIL